MAECPLQQLPPKDEVWIILAGKNGAGKTTLVNNLFDLPQNEEPSTATSNSGCQIEEKYLENCETKIVLTEIGRTMELEEKFKSDKRKPQHLLFCVPVDASSRFVDSNPSIMKTLQDTFGREIWKQCKLVFTFSNSAWDWLKRKNRDVSEAFKKYKDHLNSYARMFEEELQKLGVDDVIVRTTFSEDQSVHGKFKIVALPAGEESEDEVSSGIPSSHNVNDNIDIKWKDAILNEMVQNCDYELRNTFLRFQYTKKDLNTDNEPRSTGGTAGVRTGMKTIMAIAGGLGACTGGYYTGTIFGVCYGAIVGIGMGALGVLIIHIIHLFLRMLS